MRKLRLVGLGALGIFATLAGAYLVVTATIPSVRSTLAAQGALLINSLDAAAGVILVAVLIALLRFALAARNLVRLDPDDLYFVGGTMLGVVLLGVGFVVY
jgi:hypothetical protein